MGTSISVRREMVAVCRRLYERGLIAGPDGNVSARLSDDRILVTPAGMSKVDVQEQDLVELSLDGRRRRGSHPPSSEVAMHLRIYRRRGDVQAVVHAHPPAATGFAVAGETFSHCVLPEMITQFGSVPLIPYAIPGSEELADRFEPFLASHDVFLLANHGATAIGPTLRIAHQRMESLEHTARIIFTARLLGRVNELSPGDAQALIDWRRRTAPSDVFPGCEVADTSTRSDA